MSHDDVEFEIAFLVKRLKQFDVQKQLNMIEKVLDYSRGKSEIEEVPNEIYQLTKKIIELQNFCSHACMRNLDGILIGFL